MPTGKCGYAPAGTYGHECGRPATLAQRSPKPTDWMVFWHLRCADCASAKGPDNAGLRADGWIPYDPETQRHKFIQNRWPLEPVEKEIPA